jgi:hypothetical protein
MGASMLTAREYLERALKAFRIADEMTCFADAREMRQIAAEYLSLAAEATEREEGTVKVPAGTTAPGVFDSVAGSA